MEGYLFWGFLVIYGLGMVLLSPRAVTLGQFFRGEDRQGRDASTFMVSSSIFISWIMAKSVTNAANLGAQYGIVGGLAYALYWLCIPLAGLVIFRLRRKFGATGLVPFLTENYGGGAALAFSAALLIRLFNEIWSNTSVVGGYYGPTGSKAFVIAAVAFTLITLYYSMKGGLRSSIVTDALQAVVFGLFVLIVLYVMLGRSSMTAMAKTGSWTLEGGVDLLLVTALQLVSYPFHDPVLTDRGFICEERKMLWAFTWAGVLGFVAILGFSLLGVHAKLAGVTDTSNVPALLGRSLGTGAYFLMIAVMVSAAGSTLDSTFTSLSKLPAHDIPHLRGRDWGARARTLGMIVMVAFALLGNLPMILGANILAATTISGTMVIGLAPVFVLHGIVRPTRLGFHLSFWLGIILGVAHVAGLIPGWMAIGRGNSALLLGVNLYGLIGCTALYLLPGLMSLGPRTREWK